MRGEDEGGQDKGDEEKVWGWKRGGGGEKKEKQKDVALRPPEAVQTVVS